MAKLSGLQKQVIHFYRRCLKEARKKPLASRDNFTQFVRDGFHEYRGVDKKDFTTIELLLRRGENQFETYSQPAVRNVQLRSKNLQPPAIATRSS